MQEVIRSRTFNWITFDDISDFALTEWFTVDRATHDQELYLVRTTASYELWGNEVSRKLAQRAANIDGLPPVTTFTSKYEKFAALISQMQFLS